VDSRWWEAAITSTRATAATSPYRPPDSSFKPGKGRDRHRQCTPTHRTDHQSTRTDLARPPTSFSDRPWLTPLTTVRWVLGLLSWFGVLVAAGLGLHALAGTARSLDRRLVDDAVAIRTGPLTAVAHGASLLGRTWLLIPLAALVALALMRPLGIRAWGPPARSRRRRLSPERAQGTRRPSPSVSDSPRTRHRLELPVRPRNRVRRIPARPRCPRVHGSFRPSPDHGGARRRRAGVRSWRIARLPRRALPHRCARRNHPRRGMGSRSHPLVDFMLITFTAIVTVTAIVHLCASSAVSNKGLLSTSGQPMAVAGGRDRWPPRIAR
jgi:hypothetical protein